MSIGRKIILTSILMLLLVGGVLTAAARFNAELSDTALKLYDNAFVGVHYAQSAQTNFARIEARNPSLPLKDEDDVAGVSQAMDDLDVAIDRAPTPQAKAMAQAVRKDLATLTDPKAQASRPSLASIAKKFRKLVQRLSDNAFDHRIAAEDLVGRLRLTLIIGGAVCLLATLSIGWVLIFGVQRPLRRMILWVGEGMAPTALEGRTDEIGVLARALRAERSKVEEVLETLEGRVRDRTAELERANSEKSRFLANMSHELRTPLNGIVAVSQTLAARQSEPRDQELAELIVSSGRLLEQVLTDILDFSKIEAGQVTLNAEPFRLVDIVRRICELHRVAAEAKGLDYDWRIDPSAAPAYLGDSLRLTQILSNLLSNAIKFTERGRVTLAVTVTDEGLVIAVADTGIGFDAETGERLFRRFEQADSSIRRRFGGTGLGLAISSALAELMGGRLGAVSTPGEGSTFTLHAPLLAVDEDAAAPAQEESEGIDLTGLRVLLAEDHPTNQKVVQIILEPFGVRLDIVENGLLAVERFEREAFDVVLMDMQMPEMDGLEATRRLRAIEAAAGRPRTPVIMLTANAMDEHVRASLAAGADMHLAKPISPDALLAGLAGAAAERGAPARETPPAAASA